MVIGCRKDTFIQNVDKFDYVPNQQSGIAVAKCKPNYTAIKKKLPVELVEDSALGTLRANTVDFVIDCV